MFSHGCIRDVAGGNVSFRSGWGWFPWISAPTCFRIPIIIDHGNVVEGSCSHWSLAQRETWPMWGAFSGSSIIGSWTILFWILRVDICGVNTASPGIIHSLIRVLCLFRIIQGTRSTALAWSHGRVYSVLVIWIKCATYGIINSLIRVLACGRIIQGAWSAALPRSHRTTQVIMALAGRVGCHGYPWDILDRAVTVHWGTVSVCSRTYTNIVDQTTCHKPHKQLPNTLPLMYIP